MEWQSSKTTGEKNNSEQTMGKTINSDNNNNKTNSNNDDDDTNDNGNPRDSRLLPANTHVKPSEHHVLAVEARCRH